jgi:hypothetical protein
MQQHVGTMDRPIRTAFGWYPPVAARHGSTVTMRRALRRPIAALFVAHAFAHLVGFAWPWWVLEPLPSPPNGAALIGDGGMQVASVLWLLAAIGFLGAAVTVWLGWPSWRRVTIAAASASLALSIVCWPGSLLGVPINLTILLMVWRARPGWATASR